ncbi:ABC transporter ATP-binding protein [Phyllobacterium sp. YR531]|uniref:ABC transporter ATP-binding protein n=1 Tax=Phyllobacterium sp. YR531 TaxID=1144343 RepID=UPI00026FA1F3|nr:ABC transporter ATP-binding protein [Phyllobacterium sp. YR531]EJM98063.1 ATPase component of ABC-type sugar transporter [Phyllobacterium sp. YR531]
MTVIRLNNVRKSFGTYDVIKGVDLEINPCEFMVFVGPSGCGKSTLLRLIAGLEDITSGTLAFDDKVVNSLTPSQRGIAMVFQSYALYPHMTVYDNMAFGLKLAKGGADEIKRRVNEAAEMLQITGYLDRLPKQLSGGQRQRVAIGRAIVRDPKVFLFDEPLSNLDAALRVQTRLEIAKLHAKMHETTMIYVTHDQVEAMTLADRICVLRDGNVEQVGTPMELYEKPQSTFVAGFIGSPKMNFLTEKFADAYRAHTLGVRPEHLEIRDKAGTWNGKLILSENLGSESYLYIDIGAKDPLVVRQDGSARQQPGDLLHVSPINDNVHRFDQTGHPAQA